MLEQGPLLLKKAKFQHVCCKFTQLIQICDIFTTYLSFFNSLYIKISILILKISYILLKKSKKTQKIKYMLNKPGKNYTLILYPLLISFLFTASCSSLDINPNKSDYFKDAMESKGNNLEVDSTPITERLANMIRGDSQIELDSNITFEVALEQFSIMPLLSIDKVGGVIITDWYKTSSDTNERVKFNIIIKDEMMTNESIDIFMFKEIFDGTSWIQTDTNTNTSDKIKELILKKSNRLKATAELS